MATPAHTPTPWAVDEETDHAVVGADGFLIADCAVVSLDRVLSENELSANTAFIVRAVNAHGDLVKALEALLATQCQPTRAVKPSEWKAARIAIAKAKGGAA